MPRSLPLAVVLASLALALARAASGHDFSVDPTSPEVLQFRYGSSDVIDQTGGGPIVFAANLGIGTDELDGFSYGKDILRPANLPNFFVSLQFSVSRATLGAGGVVTTQRNLNGAAGDKLNLLILRNGRTVGPFLGSDAPNHQLTPGAGSSAGQSEIDGLSFPSGSKPSIFYTVARGGAAAPSDVYVVADWPQGTPRALYATAAQLGLQATDNIDAIAIKDGGTLGALDAADIVYVSLDAASPTRIARGGQDDVLQVWPAPIAVAVAFNKLDIQAGLGEAIDAITGYDPGPLLTGLLIGAGFGTATADVDPIGMGQYTVAGQVAGKGYWTVYRAGGVADPYEEITLALQEFFISVWHAIKGFLHPWMRGTGLGNATGSTLEIFRWQLGTWARSVALTTGENIGGIVVAGVNRCGNTAIGTNICFLTGIFTSTGQLHFAYSCDDGNWAWPYKGILLSPGASVGGKTLATLGFVDAATDASNPNLTHVFASATTASGETLLLYATASWSLAGPVFSAWAVVVDGSTPIPNASGGFLTSTGFLAAGSAVFRGRTNTGQDGIYRWENGTLAVIADKSTFVPGGSGTFTAFGTDVSNDEGATTFVGQSAGGSGIYTNLTGRLQKVVQVNDVLEGRVVSSVGLARDATSDNVVAFGVGFADGHQGVFVRELPRPFDTSDVTQRAIHVDVEVDPDPAILGADPRALLVGDLGTLRLRGIWKSNGTLGTVTIPGSELARLLALQFGVASDGGIGEWVTTVDVATGMVLSSVARGALPTGPFAFEADTNGGPWTSPLIPGGIPGTQAGFETNGGGQALFCSNAFSQLGGGACSAGAFGFPAAQPYDAASGFAHLTGPLTLGNVVLWGFLGDQRWLEAPPTACVGDTDLDSDGVCDLVDNCPFEPNESQADVGGVGSAAPPNGRGDACECGDVSNNGRATTADATLVARANLVPPTARLLSPDKCNVGGSAACTTADATIVTRANLVPPTASVQNVCTAGAP